MTYQKPEPLDDFEQEQVSERIAYSDEFLSLMLANSTLVDTVSHEGYNWIDGGERSSVLAKKTKTIEIYGLHGKGADTTQKYSMYIICWRISFYTAAFLKTAYDLAEILFKEDDILNIETYEGNRQPKSKVIRTANERPAAEPVQLPSNGKVVRPIPLTDAEKNALTESIAITFEVFDAMIDWEEMDILDTVFYSGAACDNNPLAIVPKVKEMNIYAYPERSEAAKRYKQIFILFNNRLYTESTLAAAYDLVKLIGRQDDLKAWAEYDNVKSSRKKTTSKKAKKAA